MIGIQATQTTKQLAGEYGLRNKREVWRVQLTLSKIRRAARYVEDPVGNTLGVTCRDGEQDVLTSP